MVKKKYWTGYGFYYDTHENTIWFSDYWSNVLCEYSIERSKLNRIIPIPLVDNARFTNVCYFSDIIKVDNKLFLLPSSSEYIEVYDICENSFSRIYLNEIQAKYNRCGFFERYGNNLFVFPHMDGSIFSLDINDYTYRMVQEIIANPYNERLISNFQIQHYRKNTEVFFLSATNNIIYVFDMEFNTLRSFRVGNSDVIYNTIDFIDNNTGILSEQNGEFCIIDFSNMKLIDNISIPEGLHFESNMDSRGPMFVDSSIAGDFIWFFPCQGNNVVSVSMKKCESRCENIREFDRYGVYHEGWEVAGFSMIEETKSGIVGFHRRKGLLFSADKTMKEFKIFDNAFDVDQSILQSLIGIHEKKILHESSIKLYSLNTFLKSINN